VILQENIEEEVYSQQPPLHKHHLPLQGLHS
jgi:hypothetical protein